MGMLIIKFGGDMGDDTIVPPADDSAGDGDEVTTPEETSEASGETKEEVPVGGGTPAGDAAPEGDASAADPMAPAPDAEAPAEEETPTPAA